MKDTYLKVLCNTGNILQFKYGILVEQSIDICTGPVERLISLNEIVEQI